MPGVRFGPDIADDAAEIMNTLVDLTARARRSKTGKLSKREQSKYDRAARQALDMFGVTKADLKKGRYGDLYEMAKYSPNVKNAKGKKIKGRYAPAMTRSRAKATMGEKRRRTRTMADESLRRSDQKVVRGTREGERMAPGTGGGSYLGATKTPKYRELSQRAYERMAKRGIVGYDGRRRKIRNEEDLDKANIARTRPSGRAAARGGTTGARLPIIKSARKPRKPSSGSKRSKSSQSAPKQQAKRKRNIQQAGKRRK